MDNLLKQMDVSMKDIGQIIKRMEKGSKYLLVGFMKVISTRGKNKAMDSLHTIIHQVILVNGKIIVFMAKVLTSGAMVKNTKASG